MRTLLIILVTLSCSGLNPSGFNSSVFAQEGQGTENGGGGEAAFKNIRDQVKTWLTKNEAIHELERKLALSSLTGAELIDLYENAITKISDRIKFNHDEISFIDRNGVKNIRICKNGPDQNGNPSIICNIEEWAKANAGLKFVITVHEFLGVAGLEQNFEKDYSRYPISGKILKFVKHDEKFELSLNPVKKAKEMICRSQTDRREIDLIFFSPQNNQIFSPEKIKIKASAIQNGRKIPEYDLTLNRDQLSSELTIDTLGRVWTFPWFYYTYQNPPEYLPRGRTYLHHQLRLNGLIDTLSAFITRPLSKDPQERDVDISVATLFASSTLHFSLSECSKDTQETKKPIYEDAIYSGTAGCILIPE